MSALTIPTEHGTGGENLAIRQENEIRHTQIGKEGVKLALFARDLVLYLENLKESTKKVLKVVYPFLAAAGHRINTQKSIELPTQ